MEYTTLGRSGLEVSRVCLGCLSFGEQRDWFLDREASAALVDRAMELGINFFDTANMYSDGESESYLGAALAGYDPGEYVVATKGFYGTGDAPRNRQGLSRKALDHQLSASLDRLGVDAVDLYVVHNWDPSTPIRETLRALTDEVRRGRIRYLGASKFWAHQLATALHASEVGGLERFVAMQDLYSLIYREEEREMLPLCRQEGVGSTPFSPLARGYLARPADAVESTVRGAAEVERRKRWVPQGPATAEIRDRVAEVAEAEGVTMAQVALAWVLHQPGVDAPVVGATSIEHVEQAAEAVELSLSADTLDYLEEPYEPVEVIGLP